MEQTVDRPRVAIDPESYMAVTEGVPAMLWMGDETGKCVFLNRAQREFWGVAVEDVATFDWSTTVHPEDAAQLYEPFSKAMETHTPFAVEARYRRADGAWRVLQTHANPRFDETGRFLGMTGVNTDITDQRKAERNLRESNEKLQFALDASHGVGAFTWDVPDDKLHADRNFAIAHGVDPDAAQSFQSLEPYLAAIHPDDSLHTRATLEKLLQEGGPFAVEYRVAGPDGRETWLHARGACSGAGGRVTRLSGIVIDITEAKLQEKRLALLTRELAHRIKNIFTVVRALVSGEARDAPEAKDALGRLNARLTAMAKAYGEVTPGSTQAPLDGVDGRALDALLADLFAPYAPRDGAGNGGVSVKAPALPLRPRAATSLALIFHELATNSAKYGALSRGDAVALSVAPDGENVTFDWQEATGSDDRVDSSPSGFGSQLIEASAADLGGDVSRVHENGRLHWRLCVPLASL